MSFPTTTVTSGTQAETLLVNAAAAQGMSNPTGGLSTQDWLCWVAGELLSNQNTISVARSVTAASPAASVFPNDNSISLDRAGGTINAGALSFYPVRGVVTVTSTTTFKEGFAFGVRAGATIAGVIDQTSATRVGALFAKLDVSAATLTAGQVSVAWFDWGSTASTPTSGECNVIRVQNTTAAVINALVYMYGKSTFLFDISDNSQGTVVIGTAPSTLSGSLKVSCNGNTRYIPLYTNPS